MRTVRAWLVFVWNVGHYTAYRFGAAKAPNFRIYLPHWMPWLSSLLGWRKGLVVLGAEQCPRHPPAIFASNHARLSDPLFLWGAVFRATHGSIASYFMMRDDFFRGWPWDCLPVGVNELTRMGGAIQISRDNLQLGQLRPFLQVLAEPGAYIFFPGRSRSRSGLLIEYREGIDEPGSAAFFMAHAQRRNPARRVAAVPVARTYNPVSKKSFVRFGPALYLGSDASRQTQREFDHRLTVAIGDLVVVHAAHLAGGMLYLHALHGADTRIPRGRLDKAYTTLVHTLVRRFEVDADAVAHPKRALAAALRYFARSGLLRVSRETVELRPERILAAPAVETRYRKRNPLKHCVNQVLHLPPLLAEIERVSEKLRAKS